MSFRNVRSWSTWTMCLKSPRLRIATGIMLAASAAAMLVPDSVAQARQVSKPNNAIAVQVNEAFGVSASDVQQLQWQPQGKQGGFTATVALDGLQTTLDITPKSVRAASYQVLIQVEDGSLVDVTDMMGDDRTVRGSLREIPGSVVSGSMLDDGLHAVIMLPDGTKYWVEPVASKLPNAGLENSHIVYRNDAVIPSGGTCGNEHALLDHDVLPGEGNALGAGGSICVTQLACDADVEYYQAYGSSVTNVVNRIQLVVATMNPQYENEVDITHTITTILVRTAEPDPYSLFGSDDLLCQFLTHWTNNHANIVRDVAMLFTGRDITGSTIGQATNFGEICDNAGFCQAPPALDDGAYCYVQSDCCGGLACATDLSAHELGHLWSATHCSCPTTTMNPSLTCTNTFAASNITQIVNFRNSIACLNCAAPANNACAAAAVASNGPNAFSTFNATTDGPNEPALCNAFGDSQVSNDVWFRYTATCTGNVTVDLCGSNYDTKVAIYNSCPAVSNLAIACNDDFCGTNGTRSRVTFAAVAGNEYRIRIGGFQGVTGSGVMNISCVIPNDACSGAINVSNGAHLFSTVGATTDGPNEPTLCNFFGNTQVSQDVWYRYQATCTAPVNVRLCSSNFDSKVAIYSGSVCPVVSSAIACNDDACGTGTQSKLTFNATSGNFYLIRVGGFNTATGAGTMVITCCPGDITNDGVVNVSDLLSVIQSWGACNTPPTPCLSDISGDLLVNVTDLLTVIQSWGGCP